jgi:hypothetical protein
VYPNFGEPEPLPRCQSKHSHHIPTLLSIVVDKDGCKSIYSHSRLNNSRRRLVRRRTRRRAIRKEVCSSIPRRSLLTQSLIRPFPQDYSRKDTLRPCRRQNIHQTRPQFLGRQMGKTTTRSPLPRMFSLHLLRAWLIAEERERLLDVPNAFPYVRCIETEKAGYLIRQFLYGSLYDRIRSVSLLWNRRLMVVRGRFWKSLRSDG